MNMLVLGILYLALAVLAVRTWRPEGKLAIRDRWALLTGFSAALAGFALAYALVDWVTVAPALWFVAVFVLATAVLGAVLRWPHLVWLAGSSSVLRVTITLSTSVLVIATAFVSATA